MMHYNMNKIEKTCSNGLHVILVHKPEFKKSLFMCVTPAGGFDVMQDVNGQTVQYRSGCAHYLEHQMFRLNGEDVTQAFANMQAQTNAFTSYTETAYFFSTTADIYKPLDLLLRFVETLDIDEKSVEKERGIILSEYDMYQQSPEHRLLTETWNSLYEKNPIRIDVLGNREDISNMTVKDLEAFYYNNYDPSVLTLIGITGKEIEPIFEYVENHQKNYPSKLNGKIVRHMEKEDDKVVREESISHMDITLPYVCVGYKMKPEKDIQKALKTELCVQLYLDSLFSPLNPEYQKWLDGRIIGQMQGVECSFSKEASNILFYAQSEKIDEFVKLVDRLIEKMKTEGIDKEIFEVLVPGNVAQNIRGLENYENVCMDLLKAHVEGYDFWEHFDCIQDITMEEINEICHTLDYSNKTVTKVFPK
ncbi:MAG: insulinase family protein [Holdemanella sp.]|nr:insulinase family protein [Holdemanella sp.]